MTSSSLYGQTLTSILTYRIRLGLETKDVQTVFAVVYTLLIATASSHHRVRASDAEGQSRKFILWVAIEQMFD